MFGNTTYPFRKDCQICQEAAARGRPHLREKLPPKAAVLSVDLAGPLVETEDVNRKKAKYVLVGTFTWPTGGVGEDVEDKVEEEEEVKNGEAVLNKLEDVKDQGEEEAEGEIRAAKRGEEGEESDHEDEGPEDGEGEEVEEGSVSGAHGDELGQPEEEVEERKEAQVRVHRMAIPLPSKNADDILRGVADLYLMLRSEGMYVRQIHSDLGREFKGQGLAKWCMERGVLQTFTSGAGSSREWSSRTCSTSHEDRGEEDAEECRSWSGVLAFGSQASQ